MIPSTALLQHVAILGKTGSGKTYTAKGLVEGILDEKRRLAVVDPTGAWWGLRSSADGKAPGYPVIVLGGHHADAPLPPESGAACAELITRNHLQVVFDTSDMGVGERTRWFIGFAGGLFRHNRTPIHVVIDEAHMFAPQSGGGAKIDVDTGKMLHACNTLASGGRSRGVRLMLITQRPAKLHKDSLTCCDTLISMRMISPQDREAVKAWIDGCGDAKKGREVLDSLAGLGRGEGWAWYPEGNYLERLRFPRIRTFDSSATPTDGEAPAAPKTLADIDLAAVNAALTAAVEEAKANDPKLLRAEVDRLKRELADQRAKPSTTHAGELGKAQEQIAKLNDRIAHLEYSNRDHEAWRRAAEAALKSISDVASSKYAGLVLGSTHQHTPVPLPASVPGGESYAEPPVPAENGSLASVRAGSAGPSPRAARVTTGAPAVGGNRATDVGAGELRDSHRRVLEAFLWYEFLGQREPSDEQLCLYLGYSPTSSTISVLLSFLRRGCYVAGRAITDRGRMFVTAPEIGTLKDLHDSIRSVLSGGARGVFDLAVTHRRRELSADEICRHMGWSTTSSTLSVALSELRRVGVMERRGHRLTSIVFPEGLR